MGAPSDAEMLASYKGSQGAPQAGSAPDLSSEEQAWLSRQYVPSDATLHRATSGELVGYSSPSEGMGVFVGGGPKAGAPASGPLDTSNPAGPSDAEVLADYQRAQSQSAPPPPPQAPPAAAAFSSPGAFMQAESNGARDFMNGLTFGSVDRLNAGLQSLPALAQAAPSALSALAQIPSHGLQPLETAMAPVGQAFSRGMDQQQALDSNHPGIAHTINGFAGNVAQAAFLPEVGASTVVGRAAVGAGQGAMLGGASGILESRGNWDQMFKAGRAPAVVGAALGGPLGMALGAAGNAIPKIASMADYARTKVDPMLAVNGPQSLQKIGQMVKGLPFVGAPISDAAARTTEQARSALDRIAGSYGGAVDAAEAGAPITAANARAARAHQGARAEIGAGANRIANRFGSSPQRRVVGEDTQGAIQRFARGDGSAAPSTGPARASSFSAKSNRLYQDAFGRLDKEMAGKTSPPRTVQKPAIYNASRTVQVGGSQIETPQTTATLGAIGGGAQSKAIGEITRDPTVARVAQALSRANTAKDVSFNDLRALRTWVRMAQQNTELRQTVGSANLQRLESALTHDIHGNAQRLGSPEAAAQLRRADQFYAAGQKRIKDAIEPFFEARSGEAAFDRVIGAASKGAGADVGRLVALQRSLRPQEWNELASGVVSHLGESADGFSLERMIQNYDRLSPEGRGVLFGGRNAELGRALDDLISRGKTVAEASPAVHFGETPNAAFEGLMSAARARGRAANVPAIHALRNSLSPDEWGDVVSGVIRTMGQHGDEINLSKFATEWDKMSHGAKQALFGGEGRESSVGDLEALVRVAKQMKAADKFYNHSNSGHVTAGVLAVDRIGEYVAEGHLHNLPHAIFHDAPVAALTYMGAHGAAQLLASPGFARLVLRGTKAQSADAARQAELAVIRYANDNQNVRALALQYADELGRRFKSNAPVVSGTAIPAQARRDARAARQ